MYLIIDITNEEQLTIAEFEDKLQVHMTKHEALDALGFGQRDSTGEYDIVELTSARGALAICYSVLHAEKREMESGESILCKQDELCYMQNLQKLKSLKLLQWAWIGNDKRQKELEELDKAEQAAKLKAMGDNPF